LNKDLFEFIDYAHKKSIFTMASSNMNFTREALAEQLVESGLDYFIAAIDGFSEDSYVKYRRGGKFHKAIHNLEQVLEARKQKKVSHPFVEWQYVVFSHNQHEIDQAREFAARIGVDYFHPIPGYIEDPEWITTLSPYNEKLGLPESVASCKRPWTHFNVRADGGVASCCYEFFKKDDFGNIFNADFCDIWNNEMFLAARDMLINGIGKASVFSDNICYRCIATGIRPSFEKQSDDKRA
jgi:MoaA/NifB/PqqE/SkfB family radical SAM enzyme